jgi:ADP-ribosylglycohydrolase
MARDPLYERILGSLMGAALGDALGAPTEGCSRAEITQRYGGLVRGFQPRAAGASALRLLPGEVTDDTSQLLAFARALLACEGELDAARWTAALRDWLLTSPKARLAGRRPAGSCTAGRNVRLDGSTMRRWVPRTAPRCGWRRRAWSARAMSSAPLGWRGCAASRPTTPRSPPRPPAPSGGVAVALTSRGDLEAVLGACRRGAQLGEALGAREGRLVPGRSVADQIELAVSALAGSPSLEAALERIATRVGSSGLAVESVPAAIGVFAAARGRPYEAIVAGASIGGDCDTIASMAGALAGAFRGLQGIQRHVIKSTTGIAGTKT